MVGYSAPDMTDRPSSTGDTLAARLRYRPMLAADIGRVPMDCHGGHEALTARIADLGAAGILAFDDGRHVGQLQFRRHRAELRSAEGIWNPDYWGDFGDGQPSLPHATLGIFCYHVGQLTDGEERDARYFGRGIGPALLDHAIAWAQTRGFEAMVAKCTPPHRPVMGFMGGQPASVYAERGFERVSSWVDRQLFEAVLERDLVSRESESEAVAQVGMCVRRFHR